MSVKFAHTNIVSRDWESLARFYQEAFGCVPVPPQKDLSGEWLDRGTGVTGAHLRGINLRLPGQGDGGPTLEIFQYDEMEDRLPPAANRLGFGHIGFITDDVEATRKKVLMAGGRELGRVAKRPLPGGKEFTFAYLTDPEGNTIEIMHWD